MCIRDRLIAAPIVAVATFVFRKVMRDIYRLVRNSVSELNQYMQENLVGIDVVQLSGREPINEEEYRNRNQANRQHQYRAINLELVYGSFNQSLASIATGAVIWYGGGEVVQNELTLGSMILFTQFIGMLINPIVTLGDQLNAYFEQWLLESEFSKPWTGKNAFTSPPSPLTYHTAARGK